MIYTKPVTLDYIKQGNWFLFGGIFVENNARFVLAKLNNITKYLFVSSQEYEFTSDNDLFCFDTVDMLTFEKYSQIMLLYSIVDIQIDKGIYKMIKFENEIEEAKFYLLK